jgi:eight-cysteine-cluster-containing protein
VERKGQLKYFLPKIPGYYRALKYKLFKGLNILQRKIFNFLRGMPFITQGKTNIKYILIVVILAVIVGIGSWWFWRLRFEEKPVSVCGPSGNVFWVDVKNCNKSCQINDDCIFTCGCGAINKNEICHHEGVKYKCIDRDVKCENNICVAGEEKATKDETSDWKIYKDKKYNFEFKYPKNWSVVNEICPDQDETLIIVVKGEVKECDSVNWGLEGPYDFIVGIADRFDLDQQIKGREGYISTGESITIDGTKAVKVWPIMQAFYGRIEIYLNYKENGFEIFFPYTDYNDNYDPVYNQMLSTFKFIEPTEEFCGSSTYGNCASDSDCMNGGCSGQVCQSRNEEGVITTCEWKDCYSAEKYGLSCKCTNNKCQWSK